MAKTSHWMKLLADFAADARISSKEVVSQDERGVKLELWESQKRFMAQVADGLDRGIRYFVVLKSRQLGVTTISLLTDVFWCAMHPGLVMALVTDTEKNVIVNRQIIERYVKSFPEGYFGEAFSIVKANRQFILFSNGSRIDLLVAGTRAKGSSWGEGVGYAAVHCTEVGAYGDAAALASFEESFAQENPNRLFIFESTAKGFNHWRDKWKHAVANPLTHRAIFLGWWSGDKNVIRKTDARFIEYGGYKASGEEREKVQAVKALYGWDITPEQLAWIRWKEMNAGDETDMLSQNNPWTADEAFIQSGYSFFQSRVIGNDKKKIYDNEHDYGYLSYRYELGRSFFDIKLIYVQDEQSEGMIELRVWDEPVKDGRYVIGMDTAWGRNEHKDQNVISVWRCFADKCVQVAEFATAGMDVNHSAWVLAHLAGVYKDCVVNIEVNGPGGNVMNEWSNLRGQLASEMYAERVRSNDWEDALGNARWYLYHRPDSMGAGYAYNTMTTGKVGEQIMHGFRSSYVMRHLEVKSLRLLNEMELVVVDEAGHIGARESRDVNAKDDRVYAAAFAIRAWQEWVQPGMIAEGLTYERVMNVESGEASLASERMNGLVHRFFQNQAQRAMEFQEKPTWRTQRGL